LKLKYHELLSTIAFNFNLRRYSEALLMKRLGKEANSGARRRLRSEKADENADEKADKITKVGQCRLRVSKPVLKAPMVSAFEATI